MPISYVDAGFTDIPSTAPSATWTLTLPADTQANDVFVFELAIAILNATNQVSTVPSGAVTIMAPSSGAGNTIHAAAYAWPTPATPPASVSWTLAASHYGSIAWTRFRGVDTANMLSGTPSVAGWVSNTTVTVAAMTTAHANAYVLGGINLASGSRVVTQPSGWTSRVNATERLGHLSTKGQQTSPGSTGTAVFTVSGAATYLRAWQAALRESAVTTPTLSRSIIGDLSSTTLAFTTKTTDATSVRIKLATNTTLTTNVVFSSAQTPDSAGWSKHTITGLTANTEYFYGVELTDSGGGVTTTASQGSPKTLPTEGTQASFAFAFGSCLDTSSAATAAFTRIITRDPLFFLHLGDFHYADNTSTTQSSHRTDLENQLTSNSGLRDLLKGTPTFHIKSDHDAGGGNNALPGTYTAPNRDAYKQVFAHPTLSDTNALYWTKVVGRVKFIFTDQRYLRTASPSGSLLGATQKQWFKDQLVTSEPVKIWVQDSTFNIADAPGGEDKWSDYATEQDEIGDFIRDQAIGKVITVHGDQHALASDDGSGNVWGVPSFCAAPFDRVSSHKGGPWSGGRYPSTTGGQVQQYGWVAVTDSGSQIAVAFTGYDSTDTARVPLTITVNVPQPVTATITNTIPLIEESAAVSASISGTLNSALPELTDNTTLSVDVTASSAQTIPELTDSATLSVSATSALGETLPELTESATLQASITGTLASTLPELTETAAGSVSATSTLSETLPLLTEAAIANVGNDTSALLSETLPELTDSGTIAVSATSSVAETIPLIVEEVIAFVGTNVTSQLTETIPLIVEEIAGTVTSNVTSQLTETIPLITEAATISSSVTTQWTETIPLITETVTGNVSSVVSGQLTETIPLITEQATLSVRTTAQIVGTLPALVSTINATVGNVVQSNRTLVLLWNGSSLVEVTNGRPGEILVWDGQSF